MLFLHRKRVPIKSTPICLLSPICHKIAFIATESPIVYPHNHPKCLNRRGNTPLQDSMRHYTYPPKLQQHFPELRRNNTHPNQQGIFRNI